MVILPAATRNCLILTPTGGKGGTAQPRTVEIHPPVPLAYRRSFTMVWSSIGGTARCGILALLMVSCVFAPASAQTTPDNPIFQPDRPGYQTSIDPSGNMIIRLRDNFGRPCITVRGFIRQNPLFPDVKDHMIEASNACAKLITIKVCYFKTAYCKDMRMNAFFKKVEQLGSMNNVVYFQYSFTEKAR